MGDFLRGLLISLGIIKDTYIPPIKKVVFQKKAIPEVLPLTIPSNSLKWKGLVLHHTTSEDGATRNTDAIAKYHTSYRVDYVMVTKEEFERRLANREGQKFERPWRAIGYHNLIEFVGKEIHLVDGRPLWMKGAHAAYGKETYYNDNFIGLAIVGNFDKKPPSKATWNFTLKAIRGFMSHFNFPKECVIGHWETYARFGIAPLKSCPGSKFSMDKLRSEL